MSGWTPGTTQSIVGGKSAAVCKIEQRVKPESAYSAGAMIRNTLQIAPKQPALDELNAQLQLARVVSEVVRELEDGSTQAMLNVCHILDI